MSIFSQPRGRLLIAVAVAITLLGFGWALARVKSAPPRSIVFAAGPRSGAYYDFARQYAELLAEEGLRVEIRETQGSLENLKLIGEGRADIGLVQSGIKGKYPERIRALASLYLEPLWVFTRDGSPRLLSDLKGQHLAIGPAGSGTREVAMALLSDNQLLDQVTTLSMSSEEAERALMEGEVDAAFFVGSARMPVIRRLVSQPELALMDFSRAKAYSRYHSSLDEVILHEGMLDLAKNIPSQSKRLIAPAATLVVSDEFHYSLVYMILRAAKKLHQEAGPFRDRGRFPAPDLCSFPLTREAETFFERGPSFLYRHLPFYLAATVDRLFILSLPFLTLLLPLLRFFPPFYSWLLKSRIYARQKRLQKIEAEIGETEVEELLKRLAELEEELSVLKSLPPARQNDVFLLQLQMKEVRKQLEG